MKSVRWLFILSLGLFVLGCAKAGTYSLFLRYQPMKEFPSIQTKTGSHMGIVPIKDERPETLYIGLHTNLQGDRSYFKSQPFPLEKAIQESLSEVLSRYGIKTVPIANWDGNPESLRDRETDSVLMIEIERFWTEGKAYPFRTTTKIGVRFLIHLGVKKEGKVYTRDVEMEKEITEARSTPERVEVMLNQILAVVFDSYFSNPY